VLFGRPSTSDTRLWETVSGTEATLGSTVSIANFSTAADWELTYRSTGQLRLVRNGTQLQSVTDSTLVAADKGVAITQGIGSSGTGARSVWEFILARPYDGVDPAVTVGAEQAA
jgi:hypothetical protein